MALTFLERRARWIAVALVLVASVRIVATYKVFNHTFDEPVHVACGMEWLDRGTYTYEPQHPPLARVAAALGPYLMGSRSLGLAAKDPFARAVEGIDILYAGQHYDRSLAMARLGILPFFWIACAVVYVWGERYFSKALAVIALFLFTFLPAVLAHAGLATTDMALTAFLGGAFLTGLIWVERPTWAHAACFGLFTGLAVLSKLSTLPFLPAAAIVTLIWYWATGQSIPGRAIQERLPTFALAIAIGALTIWAGYRFSFGRVDFAGVPLPAPELYAGIRAVMTHESYGHWSYLLGQRSPLGFWYFYPVALAVKTPLPFLALLIGGVVLVFRKDPGTRLLWIPLMFSAAVLQVGMLGHINIGIRHVLPVYTGFSILAAAAVLKLIESAPRRKAAGIAVAALLIWLSGSSLLTHPDYLAYFNELAGSQPEKILVDSDLDWGQDIKRLSRRLYELGAAEVTFPQFIVADLEKEHGFPKLSQAFDAHHPPQGYFAAGATYWKALRFGLPPGDDANLWPDQIQPAERIGRGMFLWHFGAAPSVGSVRSFHIMGVHDSGTGSRRGMYLRYSCAIALGLMIFAGFGARRASAADPGIWKVAPPPPASWERDRVSDLTNRRHAAMEQIGEKGILILYAAEPRNYAGDVDWPFRQENDFFYLTAIPQPGSALVLIPGGGNIREILFMPPSNPAQENWTGHILTADEGRKISGIQEVWDVRLLQSFLSTLIPPAGPILAAEAAQETGRGGRGGGRGRGGAAEVRPTMPVDVSVAFAKTIENVTKGDAQIYMISRGRPAEYHREIEFSGKLAGAGLTVKDATPIFGALRRVKSQRETEILQHAVDITAEAFQRVYALGVPGTWEYELQAQFEFTFLRRNAHWGYPCIVASGVNATTLHYETNKDRMKAGDLLLMDDAAEFDGYSVDVTRTIPVSGKYSKEQAEIYRLVWEAQQAGFKMALPGHTPAGGPTSVQGAASEVFKQGLFKMGLITDVTSDQQLRIWFNHGISHGIGLNVHDPGGRELEPGMVITVEPGIYIRPDALDNLPKTPENEKFIEAIRPAFEKYKGIGVRIEDDVMITAGAPKVISSGIPSKLEDVEATIAQLRKSQKSTPLP